MKDVEDTIKSKEEDVVCSDILDFFEFVDHEKLWENGEGFEPDAEGPDEIKGIE